MEKNEIRQAILKFLKTGAGRSFGAIHDQIRREHPQYNKDDEFEALEIFWDLLIQRVISPGFDSSNQELPAFHITDHGKLCLEQDKYLPQDPHGFSAELQSQIDDEIDSVILTYLNESLQTFNAGLYFSSVVMLGVASERLLDLLQDAYTEFLTERNANDNISKKLLKAGQSTKKRFEILREAILAINLPPVVGDSLDIYLSGVFTILRHSRNEAGHPTGKSVTSGEAHANLLLFARYCQRVYTLMDVLRTSTNPE